ncbi:MAG: hypothetical protein IPK77_07120 [Cellvibrio sp.]|nr:hypothetical protein [Cellvibrio sp.]
MNRYMKKMKFLIGSVLVGLIFSGQSYAEAPSQDPLFLVSPVKPIMMFNMSKDHQLFFKLYDDYSNIDNLPDIETTYKNTIDYYGYFDSQKCYIYNVADGRFTPNTTPAVDHYCQATTDTTRYWSGNFLNWATMTRMDAIRKILYGGYRSTDTNTLTVLERAFLPNDAHSFAKWYGGSDLRRLTPYDPNLTGVPEEQGLTLCNTSEVNDRATYSQNATGANDRPVIRLARGNSSLWASNERWQCRWGVNGNGNVPGLSRINAYANSPVSTTLDTRATINISGQVRIGANSNEVNWESGDNFNGLGDGGKITIDGTEYTIDDATSSTQLDIDTTIDPPLTGVVTITSASNQVDLVTGDFTGLAVNDVITIDGSNRQITAVNSASQLTVNYTYPLQTGNVVVTGGSNQVTYSSGTNFVNITTGSSITIGGQVRSVTAKASNNQITVDSPVTATTPVTGRVRITPSSSQINYVSGTNFANLVVGNTITIDGVARTVNTKTDNNRINVNTTYANIVGTVSHTSGSNLITYVSGTNFSSLRVGDSITFGSGGSAQTRTIASIPTSTTMTVNTNMTTTTTRGYTVGTRDRDYSANVGVPSTVAYSAAVSRNVNFTATRSTRVAGYTASYITTTNSENTELIARVEVNCNASTSSYKCGTYKPTTGTYSGQTINKPIGLLQEYANKVNFGLMTGSYRKSKSGGVLRKMVGPIDVKDELNDTNADEIGDDGIFKVPSNSGNSIIQTLNVLRLYGYSFNNGVYNDSRGSGGDSCSWGWSAFVDESLGGEGTGQCSNWGNPQAEIFLESLRYLAGKDASADFATDDSIFITGLSQVSDWDDPITSGDSGNKCAALNILQFNASSTSYDNDNLGVGAAVADLSFTAEGIKAATTYIGSKEKIGSASTQYFIGRNSNLLTAPAEDRDQLCTPKNINATTGGLGAVDGLCSEAPRLEGGYNIAGLAYLARKNGIGSDREKVKTHGVVLAPAIPSLKIPVPNSAGTGSDAAKTITILPACRNLSLADDANCAIVDFKVVSGPTLDNGSYIGSLYINWEDSEQGGTMTKICGGFYVIRFQRTKCQSQLM